MNQVKNFTWEQLKKQAVEKLRTNKELSGKHGAITPIIKMIVEAALEEELQEHLSESKTNRKNGKAPKTIKTSYGNVEIEPSRDRDGTYEPQLIKKRQMTLGSAVDEKIIALAARGMSHADISEYIEDIYGLNVSKTLISQITDNIITKVKEWQNRPLEAVYVVVWMDAIHFKVREEGHIVNKAVYCLLGFNQHGNKELLGMYIGKTERSSYWLKLLNDLKSRGLEDILIACIDNLKGFKEAIESIFPQTDVQQCVVHQVRNSMKYIPSKFSKEFLDDLKAIYKASSLEMAEDGLQALHDKWGEKYAHVVKYWQANWPELSAYFKYPVQICKIIYTTNVIESFHSQLRKITKSKRIFPSDMALMKLLYLVQENVTKKWTVPMHNWGEILSQLSIIIFKERLRLDLRM